MGIFFPSVEARIFELSHLQIFLFWDGGRNNTVSLSTHIRRIWSSKFSSCGLKSFAAPLPQPSHPPPYHKPALPAPIWGRFAFISVSYTCNFVISGMREKKQLIWERRGSKWNPDAAVCRTQHLTAPSRPRDHLGNGTGAQHVPATPPFTPQQGGEQQGLWLRSMQCFRAVEPRVQ